MKDFFDKTSLFYEATALAFVIKNHVPYSCKVVLLHQKYGKIIGIFSKYDQAALLTSGSLIWCSVQKKNNVYALTHVDIETQINVRHVPLMHEIMKLCLHQLPKNIAIPEMFDFLLYLQGHLDQFSDKALKVIMLRLFLMLDLLDAKPDVYQMATLDPMKTDHVDNNLLVAYVSQGWNNFYALQKIEKID